MNIRETDWIQADRLHLWGIFFCFLFSLCPHLQADEKQECFRKYDTPEFSYRDHSIFLATRDRYSFLFKLDIDNYEKWAKGLKKAGYATDPKYPKKLIDLIERYDLDKYDNLVLKRKNKTYRVKKGETLYSIAKKFDMTTENLKALNGIEENEISVGDRLRVKK